MDAAALPPATVELIALTKRHAATGPAAVDQIKLRVESGNSCCLLGLSGCGKSTTLRTVARHGSVSDSDVLLDNRNITNLPAAARDCRDDVSELCIVPAPVCARQRRVQFEDERRCQGSAQPAGRITSFDVAWRNVSPELSMLRRDSAFTALLRGQMAPKWPHMAAALPIGPLVPKMAAGHGQLPFVERAVLCGSHSRHAGGIGAASFCR